MTDDSVASDVSFSLYWNQSATNAEACLFESFAPLRSTRGLVTAGTLATATLCK